jgi:hypothetical protein
MVQRLSYDPLGLTEVLEKESMGAAMDSGFSAAVESVGLDARTFGLTGNQASGTVGSVVAVYWAIIDDNQVANWQNISNPQTPSWSLIDDEQTPNWEDIEVTT